MNTTIGSQSHKVNILTVFFSIRESRNDSRILHNAIVGTCAVNLHQVLIYDTSCTDIEVSDFRVTHLTIRQTNILTACLKL